MKGCVKYADKEKEEPDERRTRKIIAMYEGQKRRYATILTRSADVDGANFAHLWMQKQKHLSQLWRVIRGFRTSPQQRYPFRALALPQGCPDIEIAEVVCSLIAQNSSYPSTQKHPAVV